MQKPKPIYEVYVEHSEHGNFIDGYYYWRAKAIMPGDLDNIYSSGWSRSVNSGKKKALRAVQKMQKRIDKGNYGKVFEDSGYYDMMEDKLL